MVEVAEKDELFNAGELEWAEELSVTGNKGIKKLFAGKSGY